MRRTYLLLACLVVLLLGAGVTLTASAGGDAAFEVWAIDQSNTTADGGGTLYIYDGQALAGQATTPAAPEVVDLGGAARSFCLAQTGTAPTRPHMMMFNEAGTHALIAFVATGHVLFVDTQTRVPVGCVDAGVQAHAATPSPDDSYAVVANQNGKLLQRIATDYARNTFTLDNAATLNLATCTTPSGALCQDPVLRPDNAPICPVIDASGHLTFVTLRGGGLFVVDATSTPMAILAEYDSHTIHPNGCGGVEASGKMYINSGGGTPANPLEHDLYTFRLASFTGTSATPNTPAPTLVYSRDSLPFVDSHGAVLTEHGRYLWVADRAANEVVVVDTSSDTIANVFTLESHLSDDPAPDLMVLSPHGDRVFVSLRGPNPLTANVPGVNNAVGSTPGVGVALVLDGGRSGAMEAIAPITRVVDHVERADPHGIAVLAK